jgi:AcrR family transcriptional regulator
MGRPRRVPDADVAAAILRLIGEGGERAVNFASVGAAVGLAPSSLVDRHGSRDAMLAWALQDFWTTRSAKARAGLGEVPPGRKGAALWLKAQSAPKGTDDPALLGLSRMTDAHDAAQHWRSEIEAGLRQLLRCDRETAALIFAVWAMRGQRLADGKPAFGLRDAIRRLAN